MKPYKATFLAAAMAVTSPFASGAEIDAAFGQRARIDAAVTAAHAAHRKVEIQRYVSRALTESNRSKQYAALSSLKSLGLTVEEAIPTYRALLKDGSPQTRELALRHLANYGREAGSLGQDILEIVRDANTGVNVLAVAVTAAAALEPSTPKTASAIASVLDRAVPDHVIIPVLTALGGMGPSGAGAIPRIRAHLASHNSEVQFQAFSAIGEIKGAPEGMLQQTLASGSIDPLPVEEQYGVLKACRNKATLQAAARTVLLNAVEDKRPYIQAMALQSLADVGKSDKAAVRAMLRRIAAPDEFISGTAAEALDAIDAGSVALVDVLSEGLADSNHAVRHSAAKALKRFGVAAKPALPALVAALRDVHQAQSLFEVGAYLEVLRNLGADAKDAAPVIVDLLPERSALYRNRDKFTTHYLRAFMLLTLTEIGALDQAVPYILDGLANNEGHLYAAAARAAAKSPQVWQQALPFLTRALEPDFPDHFLTFESFFARFSTSGQYTSAKIEAIRTLGQMGAAAKSASAQLAKVAAERPEFMGDTSLIADEATKALGSIGN